MDRLCSWPALAAINRARYGFERQPDPWRSEGTAYNGQFACTCYHPLFVFNQFGDLERSALRPGNVHSADGWKLALETVVARYRERDLRRYFRADAAFANPEVYAFLEAAVSRVHQGNVGLRLLRWRSWQGNPSRSSCN
jgi:Transposase DDE domain group 1